MKDIVGSCSQAHQQYFTIQRLLVITASHIVFLDLDVCNIHTNSSGTDQYLERSCYVAHFWVNWLLGFFLECSVVRSSRPLCIWVEGAQIFVRSSLLTSNDTLSTSRFECGVAFVGIKLVLVQLKENNSRCRDVETGNGLSGDVAWLCVTTPRPLRVDDPPSHPL